MALAPANAAIFLDRDGLLNELVFYRDCGEWESPRVPEDLRLRPGAVDLIRGLSGAGWPLFLVSNQPSAAKGKTTLAALKAVQASFLEALSPSGFVETYYCYHHPEAVLPALRGPCPCRKPSPYFLQLAATRHGLDLASCWMVGDQDMDIACGLAAGCGTMLVPNPDSSAKRGRVVSLQTCDDLAQVLRFFINRA